MRKPYGMKAATKQHLSFGYDYRILCNFSFIFVTFFFQSVRSSVEHGVILTYRNTGTTFQNSRSIFCGVEVEYVQTTCQAILLPV